MNLRKPTVAILAALLAAVLSLAWSPAAGAPPGETARPVPVNVPVRLATLEWQPYVGSELPDQGYVAALVRAVFEQQGVPVQIDFHPWERSLYLSRSGGVDGLVPEYFDPDRTGDFAFSDPFPGGPLVLFKRRDDAIRFSVDPTVDQDAALRGLMDKRFGVVRGYVNTPAFDAADYLRKEEATDDAMNLRWLVNGRIDLAVIDLHVAEHLLRNHYPDYAARIEAMQPALADKPLYVGFSKKSRRLQEAMETFNRGLEALRKDGTLDAMYRHYILQMPGQEPAQRKQSMQKRGDASKDF